MEKGTAKPAAVQEALQGQAEARASALSESNIRVDVGLLDKLMNLVGELVLARNQILQFSSTQQDSTFLNTTQRLEPDHHRTARRGHEDPHAAHRKHLEQVPPRGA